MTGARRPLGVVMRRYRRAASLTAEELAALTQDERARMLVLDAHV
jgi:hypothetical protein